jgi:uncharacterized iron-regulated protein
MARLIKIARLAKIGCVLSPVMMALALTACEEAATGPGLKLYDLAARRTVSADAALQAIGSARLVLVGEHHTDARHHQAQLQVIRALVENQAPVSIGLEMFRKDQQAALDRWIAGELDAGDFERIYLDNWNFAWPPYGDIFRYARQKGIPYQVKSRSDLPLSVLLPHTLAVFDPDTMTTADADFIIMP